MQWLGFTQIQPPEKAGNAVIFFHATLHWTTSICTPRIILYHHYISTSMKRIPEEMYPTYKQPCWSQQCKVHFLLSSMKRHIRRRCSGNLVNYPGVTKWKDYKTYLCSLMVLSNLRVSAFHTCKVPSIKYMRQDHWISEILSVIFLPADPAATYWLSGLSTVWVNDCKYSSSASLPETGPWPIASISICIRSIVSRLIDITLIVNKIEPTGKWPQHRTCAGR